MMIKFSILLLIISCKFNFLDSFLTYSSKSKASNDLKLQYHYQKSNNLFTKSYSELNKDRVVAPQDNVIITII